MVRMAVSEADSVEDSLEAVTSRAVVPVIQVCRICREQILVMVVQEICREAVHLTETEALEMASRVETSKVEISKVECRAEIRVTDVQTVPAVQLQIRYKL